MSRARISQRDQAALIADQIEHNRLMTIRLGWLSLAASLVMLVQHLVVPGADAGPGTRLRALFLAIYAVAIVISGAAILYGRIVPRLSRRAQSGYGLVGGFVFLGAFAGVALADSTVAVDLSALILGLFIYSVAFRGAFWLQATAIVVTGIGYIVLQSLGPLPLSPSDVGTVVVAGAFGLFVTEMLERRRVEAFRVSRELDQQNRVLAQLSATDGLTGVMNRRTIMQHLGLYLDRYRRYGTAFSVVMIDVDHFKRINDAHGHGTGDQVLAETAQVLTASLRTTDEVGRYGGEEFVLILSHTGLDAAVEVAERIRETLADAALSERSLHVTASLGVAEVSFDDTSATVLVNRADEALYVAKNAGRNRVVRAASPEPVTE